MKIVCDNCSTKYSIADEKVRGKVFKIKCKKCSHIIVVKGDVAPEQQAGFDQKDTRVFDYSGFEGGQGGAGAAAAQDAIWHLVIDREQVGPLTLAELKAKFDSGEADAETYVWREGFADWQRLGSVEELASVAKTPPADKERGLFGKTDGPADLFGSAKTEEAPADLFAAQRSPSPEQAVFASTARTAGKSEDLFTDEAAAAAATAERLEARPKMTAQRNENSVLFSLNNLASLATDSPKAASPSAPATSASSGASSAPSGAGGIIGSANEGSGLIDIRAMAAMTLGGGKKEDRAMPASGSDDDLPVFSAAAFSAPASGVLLPTVAVPSQSNRMIYILVGFVALLAIAAIGLVVFIMTGTKKEPVAAVAPPVTEPPAPTPGPGQPAAAPQQPTPAGPTAAPQQPAPAGPGQPVAAKPEKQPEKPPEKQPAKPPKPTKEGVAKVPDKQPKEEKGGEPAPPPPKAAKCDEVACMVTPDLPCCPKKSERPKEAAPVASNLPDKLDQADIITGMKVISGRIQACNDTYRVAGGFKVKVTVGADGAVTAATASPPMGGTPTGSCVEKAVRGARFKKTKNSITFNYPYNFR